MITRYKLFLEAEDIKKIKADTAYPLYACLMEEAGEAFARDTHEDAITPIGQYLSVENGQVIWTVSLLGERAERELSKVIERMERFELHRERTTLRVIRREVQRIEDADGLFGRFDQTTLRIIHTTARAPRHSGTAKVRIPSAHGSAVAFEEHHQ